MPERDRWVQNQKPTDVEVTKKDADNLVVGPADLRTVYNFLAFLLAVAGLICWMAGADHWGYFLTLGAVVVGLFGPVGD